MLALFPLAAPFVLVSLVFPQSAAGPQLRSRTAPLRHAGVYHVATGTWTRGGSLAHAVGPDVIYNNTCFTNYFQPMVSGEALQHRSRLPSPSGPTTDSLFYGTTDSAHRYDERPGCRVSYIVNGFQFAYCSSHVGTVDWQHDFASSYAGCAGADMVSQSTVLVTGLPGGTPSGTQQCWTIDIDLSGLPGGGMDLWADGNGTYDGPSTADQFGWSFGPAPSSTITLPDGTGLLIAGNRTNTNLSAPCTGTDGTIWDSAVDLFEEGTGMSSNDFFRRTGPAVAIPGCDGYGGLHSDFHLKLFATPQCGSGDPTVAFCAPGVDGIISCPCGNPQVPAGSVRGCNNFAGGGTGGAILSGSGVAVTNAGDTLGLNVSAGVGSSVTVLFQGTTPTIGFSVRFGAGVRCVTGIVKRLYKGNQSSGAITFPNIAVPVHTQSSAKGYTIVAPITTYYFAGYRNAAANGQPGCPGITFGFNGTNPVSVAWTP